VGDTKSRTSAIERVAFTVPEFCVRNNISRTTYSRLRAQKRGPAEMRLGLNTIRITAEAERDWQQLMQEAAPEFETRALERAVKAGDAAVKSDRHISKKRRRGQPPTKEVADQRRTIRELSAQRRAMKAEGSAE
jgi:hypothetical protein